ncbi:MAG: lyase family protein [Parashewanella sp.]
MNRIWSEDSTLEYWLYLEKLLAKHQAKLGMISSEAAAYLQAITLDSLDRHTLFDDMQLVGRPIIGLIKQIRSQLPNELRDQVHYGITTQDIMDTCTCLQIQQSIKQINETVNEIIRKLEVFKVNSTELKVIARTNGQYAMPIHLSQKFTVWQHELQRRMASINHSAQQHLWLQLSGAVGDSSELGINADKLKQTIAKQLKLTIMPPHWQNSRDGIADIISAVGLLCASLTKIAHNINLLSSSDIAEFKESFSYGKGASSTMPHKKNQRYSEFAEAIARLGRQHAEQINEHCLHQHERYGGVWISEWYVVPQVFMFTAGALKWTNKIFENLEINTDQLADNLTKFKQQIDQ